jgi:uncharacterized membrane protein YhiD involved in acid resistance
MNNLNNLFDKFLATENVEVSIWTFIINLLIVVILSLLLEKTYAKCARNVSNRKMFAFNFMLLSLTTMTIITIVKSSLALSLGLIGALSIVRFRNAIKEPEELAYLFLTICIGLGMGANQVLVTVVAFIVINTILWIRYFLSQEDQYSNLFLTIQLPNTTKESVSTISEIITNNFESVELKRYDENQKEIELVLSIESKNINEIEKCKIELQKISKLMKVSFIDNKGLV